jgi:hypothetical protein
MTRVYEQAQPEGGTRVLILGASAYTHARQGTDPVPQLAQISSAGKSALDFASHIIGEAGSRLIRPLMSVDLLVDLPDAPDGAAFQLTNGENVNLAPPTFANILQARKDWMENCGPNDCLIFYCCGHGIYLPASGASFLTASFGSDDGNPWRDAIALDDFALALGDYAPRQQWLIFDCCTNTPSDALRAMGANADPLIQLTAGKRNQMTQLHGALSQVTITSSTPGAQSFGKTGRASRFMEAFLEACRGAGCRSNVDGKWWVDQQGLENAIASYSQRVAVPEEEDYFTFPRLTRTDAAEVPRLLYHDGMPRCTLLVRSDPAHRLRQANLTIQDRAEAIVGTQSRGADALPRFRLSVDPYQIYKLTAAFPATALTKSVFALPPSASAVFEVP